MTPYRLPLLLLLALLVSCSTSQPSTVCVDTPRTPQCPFGQPVATTPMTTIVVSRSQYELAYSPLTKTPLWVCETVSPRELKGSAKRKGYFTLDPLVARKYQAASSWYKGWGLHLGHMASAANQKWNQQTINETFFMTNIAPQYPLFNKGEWYQLEKLIRQWAIKYKETFYVVSGPAFTTIDPRHEIKVPSHYWKIIVGRFGTGALQVVAFLLPHSAATSTLNLKNYLVSVDTVEQFSNLDLMPLLSVSQEKQLETKISSYE